MCQWLHVWKLQFKFISSKHNAAWCQKIEAESCNFPRQLKTYSRNHMSTQNFNFPHKFSQNCGFPSTNFCIFGKKNFRQANIKWDNHHLINWYKKNWITQPSYFSQMLSSVVEFHLRRQIYDRLRLHTYLHSHNDEWAQMIVPKIGTIQIILRTSLFIQSLAFEMTTKGQ